VPIWAGQWSVVRTRTQTRTSDVREAVLGSIRASFPDHTEIAESLPEEAFGQRLTIPSNAIGEEFWCVVGARESHTNATINNG
jgi:hypothetical protein